MSSGPRQSRSPQGGKGQTTSFSPIGFDLKLHLWDENRTWYVPAAGLDVYIQTALGSPEFSAGTQPSLAWLST